MTGLINSVTALTALGVDKVTKINDAEFIPGSESGEEMKWKQELIETLGGDEMYEGLRVKYIEIINDMQFSDLVQTTTAIKAKKTGAMYQLENSIIKKAICGYKLNQFTEVVQCFLNNGIEFIDSLKEEEIQKIYNEWIDVTIAALKLFGWSDLPELNEKGKKMKNNGTNVLENIKKYLATSYVQSCIMEIISLREDTLPLDDLAREKPINASSIGIPNLEYLTHPFELQNMFERLLNQMQSFRYVVNKDESNEKAAIGYQCMINLIEGLLHAMKV